MSSRLGMISAPAQVSGVSDAMFDMINRKDQSRRDEFLDNRNERRYQLQMARQNRLDSLAAAKIERDEGRYQQDRNDRIAALTAESPFLNVDTVGTEVIKDLSDENKTMEYDADALNKESQNVPKIFEYDKNKIDQKNKELIPKYDKIINDTETDDYEKDKRLRKLMAESGMQDQLDEEDSFGMAVGKNIMNVAGTIGDRILTYNPVMSAARILSSDANKDLNKVDRDWDKKRKETYKVDNPTSDFKTSLDRTRTRMSQNTNNKAKQEKSYKEQEAFLDKFKTIESFGDKTITRPTIKKYDKFNNELKQESSKLIKDIRAGSGSRMEKAIRINAVNKEVLRNQKEYKTDIATISAKQEVLNKENRKYIKDKSMAELKSKLKVLEKIAAKSNRTSDEKEKDRIALRTAKINLKLKQKELKD
ncbi:MAG: hypothetical protein J7L15_04110 [Clostridiales bacterium]|nr:hypothetical protein [Clostridiales bacterium]